MKILVMAAHPDDEVLGCGGTIKKFIESGNNVSVLTFTDGGGARDVLEDRRNQLITSSKILGFSILDSLYFPDNELDSISQLTINKSVEKILSNYNYNPDIILTHNPWCLNVDHKKVFDCVQIITRMSHAKIMCFEVPSSSEWNHVSGYNPNCYVELTQNQVDAKMEALNIAYSSELRKYPHPRSIKNIMNILRVNGSIIGVEYAERFMITKEVL